MNALLIEEHPLLRLGLLQMLETIQESGHVLALAPAAVGPATGSGELRLAGPDDHGNRALELDVRGLAIADPLGMEQEINQWPGVVTVGIFARHRAGTCLLGTPAGVRTLNF